ncbi:Ras GTPase ras2, partial [Mortierella sp. AM989]
HTKTVPSAISHHIHLAKHTGYDLQRPTEFFDKYGSYLLTMLEMVNFGIVVAGVTVPTLTHLKVLDGMELAKSSLTFTKETFAPLLSESISYVSSRLGQNDVNIDTTCEPEFVNQEALEGADLRLLATFLADADQGKALGNLYRVVTDQGHVRWVCFDHYRENYMDSLRQRFNEVLTQNGGHLDEHEGKVMIELRMSATARTFYDSLRTVKGVHELSIGLMWDATKADLKQLHGAILATNISILTIDGGSFRSPTLDTINRNSRFDPILQLMASGKLQSFTITDCPKFLERITGLGSRSCPTLRRIWLNYDITNFYLKDFSNKVSVLVKWFPNLSELCIGCLRQSNKNWVKLAIKDGRVESSEAVLDGFYSENLLYSGYIKNLTLLSGIQPHLLKRIIENNNRLGTIILPDSKDLIQQIQQFDYTASNRLQPLCVNFIKDNTTAIKIEFRCMNGKFSGIPSGDCIQGIKSIMYIQWLSLACAWNIGDDAAVIYLVKLLECQDSGKLHCTRFNVGIENMTDLGVQATLKAFVLLNPVSVNFRCKDVNQALLTTFCSGLNIQFGSRLSKLEFNGTFVDAWIQRLSHLTRDSMPVLREMRLDVGEQGEIISAISALWIASMVTATGVTVKPLVEISFIRTHMSSDSWWQVLDAIDFTTLQVLKMSGCDFYLKHIYQVVNRLPKDAPLINFTMEYQNWKSESRSEPQKLKAMVERQTKSLCTINLGIIPNYGVILDHVYKLVVLGDGGTGKTALTTQLCLNHYVETYDPTIEDSYRKQTVIDDEPCILEILDTAGQEEYTALRDQWILDGDGFLLVYSVTARSTFERIHRFRDQIVRLKGTQDVPIMLVGHECHKLSEREVSREEGFEKSKTLRCEFIEASAETCINVERSFYNVVRMIRKAREGGTRKAN